MDTDQSPQPIKRLGDLVPKYVQTPKSKTNRPTERGELLTYFILRINAERGKGYSPYTIPRLAQKLQGFGLQDLYYLRSICDDTRNRGGSWSKCFFGSLKVPIKHDTN
jgi:hypothetical protein